jgi:hypothetical protein
MVRHYNVLIDRRVTEMVRYVDEALICGLTEIGEDDPAVGNSPEERFLIARTDSDKIVSGIGVIVVLQPD